MRTQFSDAQRANFRGAFAFINARARAGDAIIDGSIFPFAPGYAQYVPSYLTHPYVIATPSSASARRAWARARTGGAVFVLVEAAGLLDAYRPSPLDSADPAVRHGLEREPGAGRLPGPAGPHTPIRGFSASSCRCTPAAASEPVGCYSAGV